MTEEQAILAAVHAHPHEDTPRLVYSDWLEEHGRHKQAEFIRKHRVGDAVGELRERAKRQSETARIFSSDDFPMGNFPRGESVDKVHEAVEAANRGEHEKAVEHHTEAARIFREDRHAIGVHHNLWAAHEHERPQRDLGEKGYKNSQDAFEASEEAFGSDNYFDHSRARRLHRQAAKVHLAAGNTAAAHRHDIMASLHDEHMT